MNYGRKSTAKKEKELLSKGTMIRKKFTVIFAKTLLVCLIAFTVVGGCAVEIESDGTIRNLLFFFHYVFSFVILFSLMKLFL